LLRCYVATLLRCYVATLLRCYVATLLRCYVATLLRCHVATLLRCYVATLLRCYVATLLRCYVATLIRCYFATLLRCYVATLLRCYVATLLRCYVATVLLCYVAPPLLSRMSPRPHCAGTSHCPCSAGTSCHPCSAIKIAVQHGEKGEISQWAASLHSGGGARFLRMLCSWSLHACMSDSGGWGSCCADDVGHKSPPQLWECRYKTLTGLGPAEAEGACCAAYVATFAMTLIFLGCAGPLYDPTTTTPKCTCKRASCCWCCFTHVQLSQLSLTNNTKSSHWTQPMAPHISCPSPSRTHAHTSYVMRVSASHSCAHTHLRFTPMPISVSHPITSSVSRPLNLDRALQPKTTATTRPPQTKHTKTGALQTLPTVLDGICQTVPSPPHVS
jgi:hypothetical protein